MQPRTSMSTRRAQWLRLTLLGITSGLLAGAMVLLFRTTIELGQRLLLPSGYAGDYSSLQPAVRVLLPVLGGLLLGLVFDRLPGDVRQVGVVHVLRRLQTPGGERLPPANLLSQFGGALVAIVTGHSVDREGPAVHIGAAAANLLGQRMRISAEEDYTLAACGGAAAIAAVFNTPLAGVIFVIEVLRVKYDVSRFLPIIVSSVAGAVFGRILVQSEPAFVVPALGLQSTAELPALVLLGLITGALAIAFIGLTEIVAVRVHSWPNSVTFAIAGLITGVLALWTPQIMGTSYGTTESLLHNNLDLVLVLGLVVTKLVATATAVGLRVPGGLIGPTLLIGGAAGSALSSLLSLFGPVDATSPTFYATVGMVAMMGATLRAPLAALTALLELTANPNIILPGMLAVASAELTNRLVLGKESVFEVLLKIQSRSKTANKSPGGP